MTANTAKRLDRYPDYRAGNGLLEFGNDRRVIACLPDAMPELRPASKAGCYLLTLRTDGHRVEIVLDDETLRALGQQCPPLPQLPPPPSLSADDDMLREEASLLKELDDQAVQLLLREMSSDLLILFLWYMKDAALLRKVLHNCSQRAAEMLLEDLVARKQGQDPDLAPEDELEIGREAARTVLKTIRHLARKGMHHLESEGEI